jgi:hypothetical protein
MVAKQVIFKDLLEDDSFPTGGIAIYEDYWQGTDCPFLELQGVICGECGEWLDAEDVEIISTLEQWWTLDEAIKDNVAPDGTRGFRLDNQIKMELD